MNSFKDLIRQLDAVHEKEVSGLQRKLDKSNAENTDLKNKLDFFQHHLQGLQGLSDRTSPNQATKSPSKGAAAQVPDWASDSGQSSTSSVPVWGKNGPSAVGRSKGPALTYGAPAPRRNNTAPRSPSPSAQGRFVGWNAEGGGDQKLFATQTAGKSVASPSPGGTSPRQSIASMPSDVGKMVEDFRASVKKHGATGIAGIGRKFRICDDDGDGTLETEEVTKALNELGFKYNAEQVGKLVKFFDTDGDGKLDYEEFLQACRPPMTLRRKRLVQKVFEKMDTDKSGSLTANDIKGNFKPSPTAKLNAEQAAAQFLSTFDVGDHDGNVSLEEFTKYYQGVSASIDDDDYFELMIRNAWHVTGGTGWCENTSDTRCLVTFNDGSQKVIEIKNDLGLDKKNYQDVVARLTKQGITDIKKVDMSG